MFPSAGYENLAHWVEPGQPWSLCNLVPTYVLREWSSPDERAQFLRLEHEIRPCGNCNGSLTADRRVVPDVLDTPR
jgi:hypothetical protein